MKNYVLIGISILCGLLAFVLHRNEILQEKRRLNLFAKQVKVVAAAQDLVQGDVIEPKRDLTTRRMFQVDLTGQEVRLEDVGMVVGQRLAFDVKKGAPLMLRDIELPDVGKGSALAARIKHRYRAVSIGVDTTSSVSGLIRPNDHVDLVGTFRFPNDSGRSSIDTVTLTLLQNVKILAVGQQLAGGGGQGGRAGRSYSTLTLSVSPEEAELVIFAEQKGKLTATLRNPHDVHVVQDPKTVNFNYLRGILKDLNQDRQDGMQE